MKGQYLVGTHRHKPERNIFADRSSLVLLWILEYGPSQDFFSIRQVATACDVSVGLCQTVFQQLTMDGVLVTKGLRTAKTFSLKRPDLLLKAWRKQYSFVSKCHFWTYSCAVTTREEMLTILKNSMVRRKYALALHSAANAYGLNGTNLETLELYLVDPNDRLDFEKTLDLSPQERGYQVLLIEPYYKQIVRQSDYKDGAHVSNIFLTYLDLYHFPLRGIEQAEYLALRAPELKNLPLQES